MYRQSERNLLNSNISCRCPHNMVNFGVLMAGICLPVWSTTPANYNRFRILASLPQRRRSPEANQALHDLWSSPGLVHYIYISGGFCPLTEFCHVQNSLCVQVLLSLMLAALVHGPQPDFAVYYTERNYGTFAYGATYIRQGGHHAGHRPTF